MNLNTHIYIINGTVNGSVFIGENDILGIAR